MQPYDSAPEPTDQDRHNAAVREAIAARQREEYDLVLLWAVGKFGPGWLPSGRHFLVDKADEDRCRRTAERPVPAATVYTVRREDGAKRHFIARDGLVTEVSGYEEGFGPMLQEPHPSMRIDVRGQLVAPHRYSLCWAPIEKYTPRSADQLAAARVTRERNKAIKEQAKFERDFPLWAEIERHEKEEGRGR
jgi:hypothetical protein